MDLGATDYMTHHSLSVFSTYSPSNKKISTTDGSWTIVANVEDVEISPLLILRNIHVLRLWVISYCYCEFQNKDLGKMIGHAKERDEFYYFEMLGQSNITRDK